MNEYLLSKRLLLDLIVTELILNICRSIKKLKDRRWKNHLLVMVQKKIDMGTVKKGNWVKVIFEGEWFLGKVVELGCESSLVCCLKKRFGMHKPQDLEPGRDTLLT